MTLKWIPILPLALLLVACGTRVQEGTAAAATGLENGEFTTELNGLRLWFKVSGSGPVCLMPSPAWGPSSDLYFRTLKPLEKLFTIVYLDSRGTGRSQRPKATTQYTWEDLVADLEALRLHVKQESVWLMGHSEGGTQVLQYASRHPDRVSGMVLLNTAAVVDTEAEADMDARILRRQGQPWFSGALKALRAGPKTDAEMAANVKQFLPLYWSDPTLIKDHAEHFEATSMSVDAAKGQSDSKRYPFDLTGQLKRVTAPALIVVGDDDFICSPVVARRVHLSLPNSKLLLIERAGHFPWLEQPETFNAQVPQFLETLGLPRPQ